MSLQNDLEIRWRAEEGRETDKQVPFSPPEAGQDLRVPSLSVEEEIKVREAIGLARDHTACSAEELELKSGVLTQRPVVF